MTVNDRSALIPLLQQVQVEMGYVPREAISEISRKKPQVALISDSLDNDPNKGFEYLLGAAPPGV